MSNVGYLRGGEGVPSSGNESEGHITVAEQRVGISLPGVWPSIEHCLDNESRCKCVKFF
jgi:hypothetical protein